MKGKSTQHRLRHVGALESPDGFGTLVSVGVGPDGPVAMWAGAGREHSSKPDRVVALASYSASDLGPQNVAVAPVPVAPAYVQPMPDGGYLVVRSRSMWTPDRGAERNAYLIDGNGQVIRRGTLGDGISHVQVDRRGMIWVGYFDEGVVGNYGWGFDGPEPLGRSGLARWTPELERDWEYPTSAQTPILDCYAMNVTDDDVIACTYDDFPLIRVRSEVASVFPTSGVDGPHGVVVTGNLVGIIGSYTRRDQLTTGTLTSSSFSNPRRGRLTMPNGKPIPKGLVLECRGSAANLVDGNEWYEFELDEAGHGSGSRGEVAH